MFPEPSRPLGRVGRGVWDEFAGRVSDVERLQLLCEMCDEREVLRRRVLVDGDVSVTRFLRNLEDRVAGLREQVGRDAAWCAYG